MNQFELGILDFINEHLSCAFLDKFMLFMTCLAEDGIFPIALTIVLMILPKTRKCGFSMALALIIGFITGNLIIKNIVGRPRPYFINDDITLLIKRLSDFSFPSGHSLAAFETAVTLFIRDKKFGIAAIIIASLTAFSRLYLYAHFPTDVLAGIAIGSVAAILSSFIIDKLYIKFENRTNKQK